MVDPIPRATLREILPPVLLDLRGELADPSFVPAVSAVISVPLPAEPNTVTVSGEVSALWLGPDEWLIAATSHAADLAQRLGDRLPVGDLDQDRDDECPRLQPRIP